MIDFAQYVKPVTNPKILASKVPSAYGLITPAFRLAIRGTFIYLPRKHDAFIRFLNEAQPLNVPALLAVEQQFADQMALAYARERERLAKVKKHLKSVGIK